MKVHRKKRKMLYSSPDSHCHEGPSTSSPKLSKHKRKKYDHHSRPLVLLSSFNKRRTAMRKKKMLKQKMRKLLKKSNWRESPVEEDILSLNNISDIFKKQAEESFASASFDEAHSSAQDFETLMEEAECMSNEESDEETNEFFIRKKQSSTVSKKSLSRREKSNINFFSLPSKHAVVVVMDHPASVTLHGYVAVEVLSGTVSISGHELKHDDPPLRVFSSAKTGFVQVTSENFDHLWKRKETFMNLHNYLLRLTGSNSITRKILSQFENCSVALVVSKSVLPSNLQFMQVYCPQMFKFQFSFQRNGKKRQLLPSKVFSHPNVRRTISFSRQMEDLATDINGSIRYSKLKDSEGPRIILYGSQNSGKSTLLRYLVNKALTMFPVVYFLDTDPGQTEFTPPGVVSLTAVTKPIFGPPFAHQRKPISMCFVGALSAGSSPDMYSKCIDKLVFLYEQNFVKEPLFVNTMGWMQGIGLECLKNIMTAARPSVVVEIAPPMVDYMFDYREFCAPKVQYFQIPIAKPYNSPILSRALRDMAVLSYFGKCQARHERPKHLNDFKPYCISWDKIPVYKCGNKVAPQRIIESLNASVVALCRVDESLVLESLIQDLPATLEEEPDNECIGFGIVRGIDEAKHLLYIVSPLSFDEIKHVNAIIRGSIPLPNVLLAKQPLVGVPLPFTRLKSKWSELSEPAADASSEDLDAESKQHGAGNGLLEESASDSGSASSEAAMILSREETAETFGKQRGYYQQIRY